MIRILAHNRCCHVIPLSAYEKFISFAKTFSASVFWHNKHRMALLDVLA